MLNFKTGRFFVGNGNILYPSMRKKEFFQTNFFKENLANEERARESEEYHVLGYDVKDITIDIDIKFDCINDFIEEVILKTNDLELLLKKLEVEEDSSTIYPWGNVEHKDSKVKIKFNNEKFIR